MIFAVYVIFCGQNCGIIQRKIVKKQHFEGKSEVKGYFGETKIEIGEKEKIQGVTGVTEVTIAEYDKFFIAVT